MTETDLHDSDAAEKKKFVARLCLSAVLHKDNPFILFFQRWLWVELGLELMCDTCDTFCMLPLLHEPLERHASALPCLSGAAEGFHVCERSL